jgi:UDP-hydrolysing UDP-N-acetyl-D-glucosamine 2-epimerase
VKKILAITAIRSDYDLMSNLYKMLHADPDVDLRLMVAGAHLSPTYGRSVDLIRRDGFKILGEIESLIDGDSARARLKTASIFLQSAVDMVSNWAPDLLIYAGDREDVLIGGMLGTYLRIPTVHFFGGDHECDGHADSVVRHATSKLSTAHVVSIEEHKERLISIGEYPARIFVAGSIALDKFRQLNPVSREELFARLPEGKKLDGYALLIFHPVDAEEQLAGQHYENILLALKDHGIPVAGSYPNTDPGHSRIVEITQRYETEPDCWFFKNLEREWFLSLYKHAQFIIGNSSSGILEAASIPLPAINVGLRQKGRLAGKNVIFCEADRAAIGESISRALQPAFRDSVSRMTNLYGDGHSTEKAYEYIKRTDFAAMLFKTEDPLGLGRPFYNSLQISETGRSNIGASTVAKKDIGRK